MFTRAKRYCCFIQYALNHYKSSNTGYTLTVHVTQQKFYFNVTSTWLRCNVLKHTVTVDIMQSTGAIPYVCLTACLPARISQKPHVQISRNFLYRPYVKVAVYRFFFDNSATPYILPVLSRLLIIGQAKATTVRLPVGNTDSISPLIGLRCMLQVPRYMDRTGGEVCCLRWPCLLLTNA